MKMKAAPSLSCHIASRRVEREALWLERCLVQGRGGREPWRAEPHARRRWRSTSRSTACSCTRECRSRCSDKSSIPSPLDHVDYAGLIQTLFAGKRALQISDPAKESTGADATDPRSPRPQGEPRPGGEQQEEPETILGVRRLWPTCQVEPPATTGLLNQSLGAALELTPSAGD